MSRPSTERRRHPRVPKRLRAQVARFGEGKTFEGEIRNLSKGGATFRSDTPLVVRSVVSVQMTEPTAGTVRKELARVAWVSKEDGAHEAGLAFVQWRDVFKERRRHPRRKLGIFIQFRLLGRDRFDPQLKPAMLEDFSVGGLSLSADRPFEIGASMEVRVPRTLLGPPRTLRVRVVRSVPLIGRERWLIGASLEQALLHGDR